METEHQDPQKAGRWNRVFFPALLVLLVFAAGAAIWLSREWAETPEDLDAKVPVSRVAIERNPVMRFDPFLIPLGERSKYSLISLSFALEVPNGQTRREMNERVTEVRGFIYDTLREDFFDAEGIPSIQEVKHSISRAVGRALPGNRVVDVYIDRFLAL